MTVRDSAARTELFSLRQRHNKWDVPHKPPGPTRSQGGIPMLGIVPKVPWSVKEKMRKRFQRCSLASVRIRYLVIFNLWNGRGAREIEPILNVHNTTVYRVARRFCERGEASLWDGRDGNGPGKLSEAYLGIVNDVLRLSPLDHGWRPPTWTRELVL